MSIYGRDNIPYQSLIDSMITNRVAKGKAMGDNWRKQGEIWGGFAKDTGALAGRTMDALQAQEESPEARLAKLEEELRQAEAVKKYNEQMDLMNSVNGYVDRYNTINRAAADMQGYHPNMGGYGQYMETNRVTPDLLQMLEGSYRRSV